MRNALALSALLVLCASFGSCGVQAGPGCYFEHPAGHAHLIVIRTRQAEIGGVIRKFPVEGRGGIEAQATRECLESRAVS